MSDAKKTRREFLETGGLAVGAVAALPALPLRPEAKAPVKAGTLPHRTLGRTGAAEPGGARGQATGRRSVQREAHLLGASVRWLLSMSALAPSPPCWPSAPNEVMVYLSPSATYPKSLPQASFRSGSLA